MSAGKVGAPTRIRQPYTSTSYTHQFWVVGANVPFYLPEDAVAWCGTEGWDRDNCFAKLIGSPTQEDSVRYQE
ncbi:MAG: hypothetical protein LBG11_05640 [Bifidobacteriaceae bacterium]|nr:hypothetical protein [Bifidobacteriaceae bacterium]